MRIQENFYLDKDAQFALSKTFESWSPGTRIEQVIEILDPEDDDSRTKALVKIQSIQVAVPLSYMTKLRKRTQMVPSMTTEEKLARIAAINAIAEGEEDDTSSN